MISVQPYSNSNVVAYPQSRMQSSTDNKATYPNSYQQQLNSPETVAQLQKSKENEDGFWTKFFKIAGITLGVLGVAGTAAVLRGRHLELKHIEQGFLKQCAKGISEDGMKQINKYDALFNEGFLKPQEKKVNKLKNKLKEEGGKQNRDAYQEAEKELQKMKSCLMGLDGSVRIQQIEGKLKDPDLPVSIYHVKAQNGSVYKQEGNVTLKCISSDGDIYLGAIPEESLHILTPENALSPDFILKDNKVIALAGNSPFSPSVLYRRFRKAIGVTPADKGLTTKTQKEKSAAA